MSRPILVPLDGSPFSELALTVAARLARRSESALHLTHVHAPPLTPTYFGDVAFYDSEWEQSLREEEQAYLMEVQNRMRGAAAPIVAKLLEGEVVPALRQYVDENGIGLVVMTTHGRGGLSRAWLGSTADALVRDVRTPVLLLRPQETAPEPDRVFRHILITLDGTEVAEEAIEPALELGSRAGARYTLLRVVPPAYLMRRPYAMAERIDADDLERRRTQAEAYLALVSNQLKAEGYSVATRVAVREQPATAILDTADAEDVDLIAMATHGRSGWARVALGSVTDKVLRSSHRPILLLRPENALTGGEVPVGFEYPTTV